MHQEGAKKRKAGTGPIIQDCATEKAAGKTPSMPVPQACPRPRLTGNAPKACGRRRSPGVQEPVAFMPCVCVKSLSLQATNSFLHRPETASCVHASITCWCVPLKCRCCSRSTRRYLRSTYAMKFHLSPESPAASQFVLLVQPHRTNLRMESVRRQQAHVRHISSVPVPSA